MHIFLILLCFKSISISVYSYLSVYLLPCIYLMLPLSQFAFVVLYFNLLLFC